MLKTATLILLIVFAVVSLVHLFFCAYEMEKARKITKPFCLSILFIAAIVESPESFIIYIGILCGLIGDIFLLENKDPKRFVWGTAFFSVGHLCYLLEMVLTIGIVNIEWYAYIIAAILYLAFSISTYYISRKVIVDHPRYFNFYAGLLAMNFLVSLLLTIFNPIIFKSFIYIIIGYLLFILSDTILVNCTFIKDIKKRDFYIMATYLCAEFLIVFGLLLNTI
ncbi:MAG: lysoplasmalogenase family protein [Bacilli bacterium]